MDIIKWILKLLFGNSRKTITQSASVRKDVPIQSSRYGNDPKDKTFIDKTEDRYASLVETVEEECKKAEDFKITIEHDDDNKATKEDFNERIDKTKDENLFAFQKIKTGNKSNTFKKTIDLENLLNKIKFQNLSFETKYTLHGGNHKKSRKHLSKNKKNKRSRKPMFKF